MCRQRREPSGGSVAKRITVGSASVTIGDGLQKAIDRLIRESAGEVVSTLESIGDELVHNARSEWYNNVDERTGRSGRGTEYRLEVRGDALRMVVFNDAKSRGKGKHTNWQVRDFNYAYYVHRPGPFSRKLQALDAEEYSRLMSYWREHKSLPEGITARAMTDSKGRNRPIGATKEVENPKHWDGKNLWKLLVIDVSKKVIASRLVALDKALSAAGKRLAKGA